MNPWIADIAAFRQSHTPPPNAAAHEAPGSESEAYAIQDAVIRRLGWPVAGWKVGATDGPSRDRLGLSRAFVGAIFSERLYRSPAALALPPGLELKLECELGVAFQETYRAGSPPPDVAELCGQLASLHFVLELVSTVWNGMGAMDGFKIVADNGGCEGLVLGGRIDDIDAFFSERPPLRILSAGAPPRSHELAKSLDDVLEAARQAMANVLERGHDLPAGTLFATGHLCGFIPLADRERLTFTLGSFAEASVGR